MHIRRASKRTRFCDALRVFRRGSVAGATNELFLRARLVCREEKAFQKREAKRPSRLGVVVEAPFMCIYLYPPTNALCLVVPGTSYESSRRKNAVGAGLILVSLCCAELENFRRRALPVNRWVCGVMVGKYEHSAPCAHTGHFVLRCIRIEFVQKDAY